MLEEYDIENLNPRPNPYALFVNSDTYWTEGQLSFFFCVFSLKIE